MSAEPKPTEETVDDEQNWESDYSIDSNRSVPVAKRPKRDAGGDRRVSKHYEQKFRSSWMSHELLRSWVEPVEGNEYMAHCKMCDCVLKAKFSSLKTHSKSEQHLVAEKNCPKYFLQWKGDTEGEELLEPVADDSKPLIITKNINSILNDTIEARRTKVWTSSNVKSMIQEYTALKNDFRDPKQKQKLVWERLAERLQHQGINVSAEDADKKWRNLKMTFKRIFYEEGRSEQSKSQWEFYDMLLGLFSLEDYNAPVRKSRTISPPRDEGGRSYETEIIDGNLAKPTTTKTIKVRTSPIKRKPVEEYVEDSVQYHVEELQNVDADSVTVEDHKPQIVQSFDIDFLEHQTELNEPSVVEVHRVKKEILRRNPLSPTPEMSLFNSTQPPIWFKNFQKRYDTDTKLIMTKLNSIREVQNTQQNCLNILEHKMEMFEETMMRLVGTDQPEESGDEMGPEVPVEEADMEEYYIEETN